MNTNATSGAKGNIMEQWMQAGKLVFDSRVPFSLKLMLPVAAVLYWLWPLDLMPGLPFDDLAVLFFALTFFVKLANDAIAKSAGAAAGSARNDANQPNAYDNSANNPAATSNDNNVVDTTWRVIE
jgi:uncharacterized membrane protein YkvA (DUF1232 family)